jgi:HD-GYP domain-containing protein (c-di-GMP phosphodiesterase class II)
MNILVLGGTRYFGIPMVKDLLNQGHNVTIATRGFAKDPYGNRVSRIIIERTDADSMKKMLSGKKYDVVIDKIAYCSNDIKYALDILHLNKYIYMSSTSVYTPKHWNTVEEDFDAVFIQAEDIMYHRKLIESTNTKNETIRLVMRKLFQKNAAEQLHSERVGKLCKEIGKAMNLTDGELEELELLGQMHDIGKIGIQDEILNKLKNLNAKEWLEIKRHPEVGYQILRSADEYVHIAESVLAHHERADGKGYPRSLKLEEIPLPTRILAIAEAYDVMMHGSLYKDSYHEADAVKELIDNSGTQFDGEIVKIFIEKVIKKKGV